jgi:hypothetical protein
MREIARRQKEGFPVHRYERDELISRAIERWEDIDWESEENTKVDFVTVLVDSLNGRQAVKLYETAFGKKE